MIMQQRLGGGGGQLACGVVFVVASYVDMRNGLLKLLASSFWMSSAVAVAVAVAQVVSHLPVPRKIRFYALRRTVNVIRVWIVSHMLRRNGSFIVFGGEKKDLTCAV
jgi:hypothetical protein